MQTRQRVVIRLLCRVLLVAFGTATSAWGDVDMTGRWMVFSGIAFDFGCFDFVQSGTTLTGAPCGGLPGYDGGSDYSGTINPVTGEFTVSRAATCPISIDCHTITGTAALDNQSFSASVTCNHFAIPGICVTVPDNLVGQRPVCGDGTLFTYTGEQCDDGNTQDGDCCSATCQIEPSTVMCRGVMPAEACDAPEFCTGASATCPPDGVQPNTAECRPAASECDVAELCDGTSKICPADGFQPTGVACADDGNLCSVDACDGAGNCGHTAKADCSTIAGQLIVVRPGKLVKVFSRGSLSMPDTADDPTVEGGRLHVFDTVAGGAGANTYDLPAAGWTALGDPPGSRGFRYRGAATALDPCKSIVVKPKLIKMVCKGAAITLAPPFAAKAAVVLDVGSGTTNYCAEFGGTHVRNDNGLFKRTKAGAPLQCPEEPPPPSATPTATSTDTPTPTPTSTVTPTYTPGGPIGAQQCTLDNTSFLQLFQGNAIQQFALSGLIDLSCGTPDGNGLAPCQCGVRAPGFSAILIPSLFFVCVRPATSSCAAGMVDCDGGAPLGVALDATTDSTGNHPGNANPCTSPADCAADCAISCGGAGQTVLRADCEGFCTEGTQMACTSDAQCNSAGEGGCNGRDGLPFGNACDCICADLAAGPASVPGTLQCQLAFNLTLDLDLPACDDTGTLINLGDFCMPLSTQGMTAVFHNKDDNGTTIPVTPPLLASGTAIACTSLAGGTGGLRLGGLGAFPGFPGADALMWSELRCQ